MKFITHFLAFLVVIMTSCNSEELENFDNENATSSLQLKQYTNITCGFNLSPSILSRPYVVLNCIIDLKGQTLEVPSNTRLQYDGGRIINGTLVFSAGASIDAPLLSPSLVLQGQPTINGDAPAFEVDNTIPNCTFNLTSVLAANPTVTFNCILDLNGQNVTLPPNARLEYNGGHIINGTLSFSNGAVIDSRLLHHTLTLEGRPTLKDNTFEFIPENWNIVEGITTSENAQKNKEILQGAIDFSKSINGNVFKIDYLDAYFKVGGINITPKQHSEISIHLPSNFTLEMTDNTFIRMQPTHFPYANLMSTFDVDNVIVRGGHLVGDRYTHDYSDIIDINGISRRTHEWPTLLVTKGSRNIRFENIHISESTGDGFVVGTAGHRTDPTNPWNRGIVLSGCTITDCRRNGISITDGEDITIQNNTIQKTGEGPVLRTGNGTRIYDSAGVPPRFGLDIEPFVGYGNFSKASEIRFEWVENVKIINNRFTDNVAGSIIVYKADNVLIDRNFSDSVVALNDAANSTISNNTIEARPGENSTGITSGDERHYVDFRGGALRQYAVNNTIFGNTVRGFSKGMVIRGSGGDVYNNRIYDYSYIGLQVDRVETTNIHDNVYNSSLANSQGMLFTGYANNVNIYNETFTVRASFLYCNQFNIYQTNMKDTRIRDNVANFRINIYNNTFNARRREYIGNSSGVILRNNTVNLIRS